MMGTPSYMAPEQAGKAKEAGPAADVWALGAILYECLTGRPPFKAPTPLGTLSQVLLNDPVPPRRLQPGTPTDLETVCLKCLEKAPARRYATAGELADDLRRFQAGEPVRARPVGALERAAKWAKRKPALAAAYGLLAAALVLGVGGGGAAWLWLRAEAARDDAQRARDQLRDALGREQTAKEGERKAKEGEHEARRLLALSAYADKVYSAQREWEGGRVRRARELLAEAGGILDEWRPGPRPWEFDYLDRVFHPELAVLQGHADKVWSVAFSPDGARLATASDDGTARVWDTASDKDLAVRTGHAGDVYAVVLSSDGSRLATASLDGTARVWDAPTGKELAVLKGHTSAVHAVAVSPDGTRLATASWDETARVWDAATGKELAVLRGQEGAFEVVAFSPDGSRLAAASVKGTARLWTVRESAEDREKRRRVWRDQQAAEAEASGRWFAAAFHLGWMIRERPDDPSLYARRVRAGAHLGRWGDAAADLLRGAALLKPAEAGAPPAP
jgi:hypothetical protein